MTPEQRDKFKRFLRGAINANESLDTIANTCSVSIDEMIRWVESPLFERWLRRVHKSAATFRELEVMCGSLSAAEQMTARIARRPDGFDPDEPDLKDSLRKLWIAWKTWVTA